MYQYVMHEFFHTKDKRNIFRDFPTKYGNLLWSLPLRVFVAGFWLIESAKKVWGYEKWDEATASISTLPQLLTGFGSDSWVTTNQLNMPFDWLYTDATTGASAVEGAAESGGEWAIPILSEIPFWFEWFMKIAVPTPEIAIFMQKFMLLLEISIGFAILFGLFTWLASAASAAFIAMFTLTAMLGWSQLWVFPASIALMNGSGRTIGLDYWVVPFLQKTVGDWWYGKERAIYTDYGNSQEGTKEEKRKAS